MGRTTGYSTVSRLFHWVTAVLVILMIGLGLAMSQDPPAPWGNRLYVLHKAIGPMVFVLVLARLGWRAFHRPPPLPLSVPMWQVRAAGAVHALLYAALLVMPISGYVHVDAGDYPLEFLRALGLPQIIPKNEPLAHAAESIHAVCAWVLIGLIGLHVGAALHHGFVLRDGVVRRMWPPVA